MTTITPYLKLMRPRQWVKNLLIPAPAFFAGTLFFPEVFLAAAIAVVAFCLTASAVYVINDLLDRAADSKHPTKCLRPLPSGKAKRTHATVLLSLLLVLGFGLASTIPYLLPLLVGYVLLNIVYSLVLKHVPVVDIVTVASFYVMRIIAGAIATATFLSPWIVLATFFLALFLVSGKRLGEFGMEGQRKALDGYAQETLDGILLGSATLSIVSYGLWSVLVHPSPYAVYTVIPVAAVIFRTMNRLHQRPEEAEAPEILVFTDPWTFGLTVLWGIGMLMLFYIG